MKKNFLLHMLVVVALSSVVFVGCKDDDDSDGGGQSTPVASASYFGDKDNERQLTSVGNWSFGFNDDDILSKITYTGTYSTSGSYTIKTKDTPYTIVYYSGSYSRYANYVYYTDFRFSSSGYITSLKVSTYNQSSKPDEDDEADETENWSFSYNGDGQMTSASMTYSESSESSKESGSESATIEYDEGDIASMKVSTSYEGESTKVDVSYKDEVYYSKSTSSKEEWEYTFETSTKNQYGQNVQELPNFSLPMFSFFGPLGWYGKGSAHFISSANSRSRGSYSYSTINTDSYGFVSKYNGNTYKYSY